MRNFQVGEQFVGSYDGKNRKGTIDRVGDGYIVVKQEDGSFRTFRLAKIQPWQG